MKTEILLEIIDGFIAAAPEAPVLSPAEQAAADAEKRQKAWDIRAYYALGYRTGWPAKTCEDIKTPAHGQDWQAAYQIAKQTILNKGIAVFYGKRGTGKTRMAGELAMLVGSSRYRTAMRFFLEVRSTYRKESKSTEMEIIDSLANSDLLILDEIQERGETDFENKLLTHLIDARYAMRKPTILIANLTKAELAKSLGASIVDRARENGKSIEFSWDSYR